ncbi:MAG: hypothetical protein KAR55_04685 [Thermoplasmatales archaeon]|nr:hypothetical protein [Thermoplasmatales archaeon]
MISTPWINVKKYTKDIPTVLRIPVELEEIIRDRVRNGKSIREIRKELNVCRDTVIKYTRDIPKCWTKPRRPLEQIQRIRKNVKKYNSKLITSRIMGIPYSTVRDHTMDIKIHRGLSKEQIKKIREEVLNGKSKTEVAEENKISYGLVRKHTRDIPVKIFSKGNKKIVGPSLRGKNLEILIQLLIDGYYICSRGDISRYRSLRKYFPTICRVSMKSKTIIFLEDKSDIATRAYLESLNKRITNYNELKQIIKAFKTSMDSDEKKKYIYKKSKKEGFGKNFEATRLRENDDSFVKIKLFHLFTY